MANKFKQICVVGWHNWPDFYNTLELAKDKYEIWVLSHRENPYAKSFNNIQLENIGLEYHCYDYFIKNVWDKENGVLFMHDDISILNKNCFKKINNKIETDVVYLEEKEGRCIYLSPKTIKYFINNGGIWYDKKNKGHTIGEAVDCEHYNAGIDRFNQDIDNMYKDGVDSSIIVVDGIKLAFRGERV